MINPMLLQQPQIRQLIGMMKAAGNPQAMLSNIIMNNPNMKSVMDYVNGNGGDPQAAFYKKAAEMGIDPEEILSQLR